MNDQYNIAVRALVEFVLRNGDLSAGYFSSVRAIDGIRAHQKVQAQRPAHYQAEVPLSYTIQRKDIQLCVSGRVDGIFHQQDQVIIEEIKTTSRPLKDMQAAPDPVHWGQVKCYAYMWAAQNGLDRISAQLTYVDPQKGNTCEILHDFDLDSLHDFFEKLLDQYLEWLLMQVCWRKKRDDSLRRLDFPYHTYREGQRAMAVEVYRTIRDNKQLMAQAATGIGKTMAAVFPAVKALGEQLITKVIFLTARTTGRLAAEAAFDLLRKHGACLKTLSLTAKEKICFNPQIGCDPELCEYAKGFYDRINTAMAAAFAVDALERSRISSIAREFKVCPFELSLEMVNWVDGIIGDYNYAFDPNVMLKRLFLENHDRHAVLVDEAHNLVDRAREMFSAQLGKESVINVGIREQLMIGVAADRRWSDHHDASRSK